MILRKGNIRVHHFAHKGKSCLPQSDPNNYLHQVAQDKIIVGFRNAQNTSNKYYLGVNCVNCQKIAATNIATDGARVDKERVVVEGTRSDIVVEVSSDKKIIIEIINTHDLESETRSRYIASGIPVFKRKVSWGTIQELDKRVIADDVLNGKEMKICAECRQRQSRAEAKQRQEQEVLERRKKVIDAALSKMVRKHCSTPSFCTWFEVSKANWSPSMRPVRMYPDTQRLVFANAIILTELGFEQHDLRKPYLFRYVIRSKDPRIVLYADLGISDVAPVYENTAAMLDIPELKGQPKLEKYAIDSFGRALQKTGVNVRTGFESVAHIEQKNVDPTRYVSKAMLNSLIQCTELVNILPASTSNADILIDDDIVDLMEDYPGKPVKSPRKWVGSD